jgi:8-oxo-dGTP pyrophosphatase MutT (NUDIX family)
VSDGESVSEGTIRRAATVVAARDGRRGVEVLVMRRAAGQRFLAGFLVFPGGAVDLSDAALAERWFNDPGEASRAAAVRELVEEAGLVLTADGLLGEVGSPQDALARVDASPPSVGALREIAHWVAPPEVPVRFDARFYAVAAPLGVEPRPDGHEAEELWWARPIDVLVDFADGLCDLYWPTFKTMEGLAGCSWAAEVLALRIPQAEVETDDDEAQEYVLVGEWARALREERDAVDAPGGGSGSAET